MQVFKKTVVAAVLAGIGSVSFAYGEAPFNWVLNTTYSTSNVKVYQKIGSETYAQVADMGAGAKIEMKQTYVKIMTHYGRNLKAYKRDLVSTWYANAGNPVSVINGDYFFNSSEYQVTTPLSFGVRSNGALVDLGSDQINDKQVEFFPGQGASVTSSNQGRISNGPALNIVGGYSPSKAISKGLTIGRTGICTLSPTSPSRLVLFITATAATQSTVDADFSSWKCIFGSQIMMDGSASSQLSMKNNFNLRGAGGSPRTVPQVIVIRNN